jgi:hypothetical protein
MDEGVDPTHMCQSLVERVARSRQLQAVADPDILVLFESWLEELEEEVIGFYAEHPDADVVELAASLGFSRSGASFFIAKLKRENKI